MSNVISTYIGLNDIIKTELKTILARARSQNIIEIDENNFSKVCSIIDSTMDSKTAEGALTLETVVKKTATNKTTGRRKTTKK